MAKSVKDRQQDENIYTFFRISAHILRETHQNSERAPGKELSSLDVSDGRFLPRQQR